MQTEHSNFENLVEHVKQYVETRLELAKLDTAAGLSATVSFIAGFAVIFLTIAVVLLFASCAAAIMVGQRFGNVAYGYLCVAAIYLVLGIILYAWQHKWLKMKVTKEVLKRLTKNDK